MSTTHARWLLLVGAREAEDACRRALPLADEIDDPQALELATLGVVSMRLLVERAAELWQDAADGELEVGDALEGAGA